MPQPIDLIESALSRSTISTDVSPMAVTEFALPVKDQLYATPQREVYAAPLIAIDPDGPVNRLLAAAVINRTFRHMLLTNPHTALAAGYRGESFALSTTEREMLLQIHAATLPEFAQQLLTAMQQYNDQTMRDGDN